MEEIKFDSALFAPDGELLGVQTCVVSELSQKWLVICRSVIDSFGDSFQYQFKDNLSHLKMNLTSAGSGGLGSFYVHDNIVLSTAYLRGFEPSAEDEMLEMFIASLRRVDLVQKLQSDKPPFEEMFNLKQRPLQVVVIWGNTRVSDEDQDLAFELSDHFAGAFLS
jgi:hypothetical protein